MAAEFGDIFVDTNVLIYAYSDTELEKKKKVLSLLTTESIAISTQVVNEFIWVMNRKFNVDFGSLKFIINNLFDLYKVCIINQSAVLKAIDLSKRLNFSYWDSLMLAAALELGCNIFYTEDLQDGQNIDNQIIVVNPFIKNTG